MSKYTEANVEVMNETMADVLKKMMEIAVQIADVEGDPIKKFSHVHFSARTEIIADACKGYPANVLATMFAAIENSPLDIMLKLRAVSKMVEMINEKPLIPLAQLCPTFDHTKDSISEAGGFASKEEFFAEMHAIGDPVIDSVNKKIEESDGKGITVRVLIAELANSIDTWWETEPRDNKKLLVTALVASNLFDNDHE